MVASVSVMRGFDERLGKFWPNRFTIEERSAILNDFRNKIFPLWKPIFNKLDLFKMTEREAYHRADLNILDFNYDLFAGLSMENIAHRKSKSRLDVMREKAKRDELRLGEN